jgi:uncharacterized protein YqeY
LNSFIAHFDFTVTIQNIHSRIRWIRAIVILAAKYCNSGRQTMVMIKEIIEEAAQMQVMQPTAVAQQARVNKVVQQRIASQAQQPATEMGKVKAMIQTADLKKRTDQAYAKRLRKQLANAESQVR